MIASTIATLAVNRVLTMVTRAEFKRRQAPPGLKITDRAFGTGWRMPIANKWVSVVPTKLKQSLPSKSTFFNTRMNYLAKLFIE
jgi:hypothetical protein